MKISEEYRIDPKRGRVLATAAQLVETANKIFSQVGKEAQQVQGGYRLPCPLCGTDLRIAQGQGRVIAQCKKGCDYRQVLHEIQRRTRLALCNCYQCEGRPPAKPRQRRFRGRMR